MTQELKSYWWDNLKVTVCNEHYKLNSNILVPCKRKPYKKICIFCKWDGHQFINIVSPIEFEENEG